MPVASVQTNYETFNWAPLDAKLNEIAGRGHQSVFRFYLDNPAAPSGIPAFLDKVPRRSYTDHDNRTSVSPDYDHPDMQRAMVSFVRALGKRYDGDPRIGFITVGMLGFWGEWHTYPHIEWMASTQTQNKVLDAWQSAFTKTRYLLREPKDGTSIELRPVGFHDDSFAYSTLGPVDWHFWPKIESVGLTNRWRTQPIGGEVRPEIQGCMWNDVSCVPQGQEFDRSVQTTHASWMINHGAFATLAPPQRDRAIKGAQSMGYDFWVPRWDFQRSANAVTGSFEIVNRGVAPFYYPWKLQLAVWDGKKIVRSQVVKGDVSGIQPGTQGRRFTWSVPNVSPGHKLLLRVQNPLSKGVPLRFSNREQDADSAGWLTLGSIQ